MCPERPVEEPELDLSLAALFAGYALNDEVQRRLHSAGFKGLRFSHGFLVQHLVAGERSVGELAELMGITQQAVSKTVGELETLGYLERRARAADARVRLVTLTRRGREAIETAREARAEVVAPSFAGSWDRGVWTPQRRCFATCSAPRARCPTSGADVYVSRADLKVHLRPMAE